MDDIRDITSGSNSEQTSRSGQQSTTPHQYSPYGQHGQYGRQYGQYGQTPDPKESNFPEFPAKQKKNASLPAIIMVIMVLAVILIGLITLVPPYTTARKFGKALAKNNDINTIVELVYPEGYMEKSGIDYNVYEDTLSQCLSTVKNYGEIKYSRVKMGKKIKSNDLKDIESFYDFICEVVDFKTNVKIEKGYEAEIKFKHDDYKSTYKCCVVKMKGEGWKIFPLPVDEIYYVMNLIEMAKNMELEY